MSARQAFDISIIGERINPGFKSTKALFDNGDMAGIQALAVRQAEAGACYLNVNVGSRALIEPEFMAEIVRAIQAATAVPPSLRLPRASRRRRPACGLTIRHAPAAASRSSTRITEHRWELMELYRHFGFKVMVMASERIEDGVAVGNKTAEEIHTTGAPLRAAPDARLRAARRTISSSTCR